MRTGQLRKEGREVRRRAMIKLEKMRLSHLEEVLALEKLCFTNPWSREAYLFELRDNQLSQYLVALAGERIIAYGGMWLVMDEAHVTNIAVHPDFRRQGIGESLLRCLMARAYGAGARSMTLEVRRSNLAAQELYRKLGFRVAGYRKGYYSDNGEDALIMWSDNLLLLGEPAGDD